MKAQYLTLQKYQKLAKKSGLVSPVASDEKNFKRRARSAYKRNLKATSYRENGEMKDFSLLAGLAIAEAYLGRGAGWIPAVQGLGVKIAELKG